MPLGRIPPRPTPLSVKLSTLRMSGLPRPPSATLLLVFAATLIGLAGCSSNKAQAQPKPQRAPAVAAPAKPAAAPATAAVAPKPATPPATANPVVEFPVMLGVDVLESTGFRALAGKRISLLTHPAGVNRRGESTITVLRRAPNAKFVCLFSPEHSLSGDVKASVNVEDSIDSATKLPVY